MSILFLQNYDFDNYQLFIDSCMYFFIQSFLDFILPMLADFFLAVGLGLGSTDTPQVRLRKSISNERTFAATADEGLIFQKLGNFCLSFHLLEKILSFIWNLTMHAGLAFYWRFTLNSNSNFSLSYIF